MKGLPESCHRSPEERGRTRLRRTAGYNRHRAAVSRRDREDRNRESARLVEAQTGNWSWIARQGSLSTARGVSDYREPNMIAREWKQYYKLTSFCKQSLP